MIVGPGYLVCGGEAHEVIPDGGLRIVGSHVAQIGRAADLAATFPDESLWPARGRVILPGLVNTHSHLARHLARGLELCGEPEWARYDSALAAEDIYWSALAGLVEGVRHGVTTVFDFHRSSGCVENSLLEIRAAAARLGVRAGLCYGAADREGAAARRAAYEECLGLASEVRRERSGRVAALVGVGVTRLETAEEALFEAYGAAGGRLPVHAALELDATPAERWVTRSRWPARQPPTQWAHAERAPRGFLGEIRGRGHALSATGADSVAVLLREAEVSWGSDGAVNAPPVPDPRRSPGAAEAEAHYRRLFVNGPRWAEAAFGAALGRLEPGAHADLLLVDYLPATELDRRTLPAHLWSGMLRASVSGVMVAGDVVMDDGRPVTVDEQEVAARARECADRLWRRLG